MPNLTLEDIAKLAGVSRSTVSRVINDQPNVRPDVRDRILEIIRQTGYHPNAAARTLASNQSQMLGLVLPRSVSSFFVDPYFPRLTQGIAQACNLYDYTLSLFLIGTPEDEEKIYPRLARQGLLDGLLIQSGNIGDRLTERLITANIPAVIIGRPLYSGEVSFVDVDNVASARHATAHLITHGYQRVATIAGDSESAVSLDRLEGYRQALAEHGIAEDPALIAYGDYTEQGGYEAMKTLLSPMPDAVFAASDSMAIGAIKAAREYGLKVPDDVAFIGYDDLPVAAKAEPPLTTVHQPIATLGGKAVETLLDLIENGTQPARRIIMDTRLVIRKSCGTA